MAHDMKTLVGKIRDLRHLGIEDSKIALPKICVVGDQSTGKSSLIEGMSEIKVPRSAGTCTRCPLEINLTEANQPWTCHISLCSNYMYDGQRKIKKLPEKSQPLGPWVEQDQEKVDFITLNDKDKVQEALRCAQLAILNPKDDPAKYHPDHISDIYSKDTQVKFSPNVIRLDISAPGFPNLSFYDLPGVISQAEFDEERYLVTLVENLVKEYISQENCIVLLTLPMTDDATNSSAARIVRDIKNATTRTLGVLTKPDRVEDLRQWTEILSGDKFAFGHGYYVVRNNPDPSVGHSQARLEEGQFFASPPWTTELVAFQERFGTRKLQTALSGLLLEQIQRSLPLIIRQINEKAEQIDNELLTLPEPPSANFPYILCSKLNDLKVQIRSHIDGGSKEHPMQKIWVHIAKDFEAAIRRTRPNMKLIAETETFPQQPGGAGDSDCELTIIRSTLKRKSPGETKPPVDVKPQPSSQGRGDFTTHFNEFRRPAKVFPLEEIRGINEDSISTGIQGQIHTKAIEQMNQISVRHWVEPLKIFLAVSHKLTRDTLLEQVDKVFSQYKQTDLYRQLVKIIESYLAEVREDHYAQAFELYQLEYSKPFTMATSFMTRAKEDASVTLKARRREVRVRRFLELQGRLPDEPHKREAEIRKVSDRELGPDPFEREIEMMATVRGYYEVASSRFVDSICQGIHIKLFSRCREELFLVIEKALGILEENALERCMILMAEDPERQKRRQYLVKERAKLTKAQEWLAAETKEEDDVKTEGDYPMSFGMLGVEDDKTISEGTNPATVPRTSFYLFLRTVLNFPFNCACALLETRRKFNRWKETFLS
ncbi:hypothetical protein VTN77DRAFT_3719 [Rasamsonia byssochlamydoides]|uniref:uncharacterized protein n=1 Tax=Rasamsonia byssochlamydoides TaxID=89139 RepID=UPI00374388A1